MVMMGKLHLYAAAQESRDATNIRKSKNRAGIIETRALICPECAEEFCSGINCSEFLYDNFLRSDEIRVHIESLNGEAPDKSKNNKKKPKPKKNRAKSSKKKKGKRKKKKKSDSEDNV